MSTRAQDTTPPPTQQIEPTAEGETGISPRGAFLRAVAIPGWGHAAIGSYSRGGFYVATQSATLYTLLRTRHRIREVDDRLAFREEFVRQQAMARGLTDPMEIEAEVDADGDVLELRSLRESRGAQQEDMVALGIFLLFLSGADAYVSAHLSRFPESLDLNAVPVGDGRYELAVRVRLPN